MKPTLDELKAALEKSWDKDTAWKRKGGKGLPDNQCMITAKIVQDFFGGDILRVFFDDGDSHYWNRLPDGTMVDLTSGQFGGDGMNPVFDEGEIYKRVLKRYERLKNRVLENLRK